MSLSAEKRSLKRIDDVCDRFEPLLRRGQGPKVEEFLELVPEPDRGRLLQELIVLEVDRHREYGERVDIHAFRQRFPDYTRFVDAAFDDSAAPRAQAAPDDSDLVLALDSEHSAQALEQLKDCIATYEAALEDEQLPPDLRAFLPGGPPMLRRIVLIDLIKLDMEARFRAGERKKIEAYCAESSELDVRDVPVDLVYEELRLCRLFREEARLSEFQERFPQHRDAIDRLIETGQAKTTTLSRNLRKMVSDIEPGQFIDDFELIRLLGQGAFGKVFLARQRSMQRIVALKITDGTGNEPQTLSQFNSDQIVRVYDQREVTDRGLRLLYMEYVPGGTLENVLRWSRHTPPARRGGHLVASAVAEHLQENKAEDAVPASVIERFEAMSWAEAVCKIGIQIAQALETAHMMGTLHRDLKPANVLLTARADCKLADFNIAYGSKIDGATPAAFFGGSLAYMSPEQLEACIPDSDLRPEDLDGSSDIYSLAVLLWELLFGQRPFADEPLKGSWTEALEQMITLHKNTVLSLPDEVSQQTAALVALLKRCLEADPEVRLGSAAELIRELRLCQQDEVQQYLGGRQSYWTRPAERWPLSMTVLTALLPSLLLSIFNVAYDWHAIVSALPGDAQRTFMSMIATWKLILYGLGTALGVWYTLPVFLALRPAWTKGLTLPRRRCLVVGDAVFWVTLVAWTFSGIVFPAWIHLSGHELQWQPYFHFFAAHLLCGLIAATTAFFLLTLLSVRVVLPKLLRPDAVEEGLSERLFALQQRVSLMRKLAYAAPLISAISLGVGGVEYRSGFVALAVLSAATLWLVSKVSAEISHDYDALTAALSPSGQSSSHAAAISTGSGLRR